MIDLEPPDAAILDSWEIDITHKLNIFFSDVRRFMSSTGMMSKGDSSSENGYLSYLCSILVQKIHKLRIFDSLAYSNRIPEYAMYEEEERDVGGDISTVLIDQRQDSFSTALTLDPMSNEGNFSMDNSRHALNAVDPLAFKIPSPRISGGKFIFQTIIQKWIYHYYA